MKISVFALAAMLSSASAEFSLRAAVNSLLASAATETYDARIVVGGLTDVVTDEEAYYISKEAVAAYNKVIGFDNAGQKLGDIKTRGFSNVPADSIWWKASGNEEAALINAEVDVLYYKDGFGAPSEFGELHEQFQEDLCKRLRASGFTTLVNAKDCTFSFLEHPGLHSEGPVETAYEGDATEAQIALVGLKNEMTSTDAEFFNKVVVDAHNQAFSKTGLSMTSFQALADIGVSGSHHGWLHTCAACCLYWNDDRCPDDALTDAVTLVVAKVSAVNPAHNKAIAFQDAKISHADFENFLCFQLRNSGNPTFENVHDCTFNFVYNPVGKSDVSSN